MNNKKQISIIKSKLTGNSEIDKQYLQRQKNTLSRKRNVEEVIAFIDEQLNKLTQIKIDLSTLDSILEKALDNSSEKQYTKNLNLLKPYVDYLEENQIYKDNEKKYRFFGDFPSLLAYQSYYKEDLKLISSVIPVLYIYYSEALRGVNRLEEAINMYKKAYIYSPCDLFLAFNYASMLGEGNFEAGLQILRESFKYIFDKEDFNAHLLNISRYLYDQGLVEDAEKINTAYLVYSKQKRKTQQVAEIIQTIFKQYDFPLEINQDIYHFMRDYAIATPEDYMHTISVLPYIKVVCEKEVYKDLKKTITKNYESTLEQENPINYALYNYGKRASKKKYDQLIDTLSQTDLYLGVSEDYHTLAVHKVDNANYLVVFTHQDVPITTATGKLIQASEIKNLFESTLVDGIMINPYELYSCTITRKEYNTYKN